MTILPMTGNSRFLIDSIENLVNCSSWNWNSKNNTDNWDRN